MLINIAVLSFPQRQSELIYAIRYNNMIGIRLLCHSGVSPDDFSGRGCVPLLCAVEEGFLHIVQYLIKEGADVNIQNDVGETALYKSIMYKRRDIFDYLLETSPTLSKTNLVLNLQLAATINDLYYFASLIPDDCSEICIKTINMDFIKMIWMRGGKITMSVPFFQDNPSSFFDKKIDQDVWFNRCMKQLEGNHSSAIALEKQHNALFPFDDDIMSIINNYLS